MSDEAMFAHAVVAVPLAILILSHLMVNACFAARRASLILRPVLMKTFWGVCKATLTLGLFSYKFLPFDMLMDSHTRGSISIG